MSKWYSRSVFFVKDAERSIVFYRDQLGCSLDWNYQEEGRAVVCQLGRPGFEVIIAAQEPSKAGHGRIFIALDRAQELTLRKQIEEKGITASDGLWGMPVFTIEDPDGNQLMFSPPSKA